MENLKTPTFINILLGMAGGMYYRQLKRASKNPRKSQEKTLRGILTLAKDTVYGREHDFAYILGAEDDTELYKRYQEKVQIGDYEDFRPYVERHKNGESDVLFPGKPALYTTTSGSTSQPKWIPIFPEYLDKRNCVPLKQNMARCCPNIIGLTCRFSTPGAVETPVSISKSSKNGFQRECSIKSSATSLRSAASDSLSMTR